MTKTKQKAESREQKTGSRTAPPANRPTDPPLLFAIELREDQVTRLALLTNEDLPGVKEVVEELVATALQGIQRPGSWERPWLERVFDTTKVLQADKGEETF